MTFTLDVRVDPGHLARALRSDVAEGLSSRPKDLPPKWFYDDRGSQLFEEITKLPEYYPTRRELAILQARSEKIAEITRAQTLVELGSGVSTKTLILLDALQTSGSLRRFVPFDVSVATLRDAAQRIASSYPRLDVHAVAGDLDFHLDALPKEGETLVIFLGGTIGNFEPGARKRFLNEVADGLANGDWFLLGVDLVKDVERIVAAYNDSAGVTAAFNKNVLHVINRGLHADFVPDLFEHRARWMPDDEWIEMSLVAKTAHTVHINDLDLEVHFDASEAMRTEISAKFHVDGIAEELAGAGLSVKNTWVDPDGDFALVLAKSSLGGS